MNGSFVGLFGALRLSIAATPVILNGGDTVLRLAVIYLAPSR